MSGGKPNNEHATYESLLKQIAEERGEAIKSAFSRVDARHLDKLLSKLEQAVNRAKNESTKITIIACILQRLSIESEQHAFIDTVAKSFIEYVKSKVGENAFQKALHLINTENSVILAESNPQLNDLIERASRFETMDDVENRLQRLVLLDQIYDQKGRSPAEIKQFLDKNADQIQKLHMDFLQGGQPSAADQLSKFISENLLSPVYDHLQKRAVHGMRLIEEKITNGEIDDAFLKRANDFMVAILNDLGFDQTNDPGQARKMEALMEKFSELMVNAHEIHEKQQIHRISDEILAMIEELKKGDVLKNLSEKPRLEKRVAQVFNKNEIHEKVHARRIAEDTSFDKKQEKPKRPSTTAQLFFSMSPKTDRLSSLSVANPLAGIAQASLERADTSVLAEKQRLVVEDKKKSGIFNAIKTRLTK